MLRRLYVDNYKTLQNFEWSPERVALLMGRNGSGKTTVLDALRALRAFVIDGVHLDDVFPAATRTRWDARPEQRFEVDVEAAPNVGTIRYTLRIGHDPDKPPRVLEESLAVGETRLFAFRLGQVQLYKDSGELGPTFGSDWRRSALCNVAEAPTNKKLTAWKGWLDKLLVVRPNPARIGGRAPREERALEPDCGNFAGWYRMASQERPDKVQDAFGPLASAMDGFRTLSMRIDEQRTAWVRAKFTAPGTDGVQIDFDELSDGQRVLITLYTLVYAGALAGATVAFDEPDNYVSLDEIQPFVFAALERTHGPDAAQVLFVSHHPELINLVAPASGHVFFREQGGPTRVRIFASNEALSASEVVLRGGFGPEAPGEP